MVALSPHVGHEQRQQWCLQILAKQWPGAKLHVGFSIPIQMSKRANTTVPPVASRPLETIRIRHRRAAIYTKMRTSPLAVQLLPVHILRARKKHLSNAVGLPRRFVAKRSSHEFMDGVTFASPEFARLLRGRLSPLPVARWRFESSKDPWRRPWEG